MPTKLLWLLSAVFLMLSAQSNLAMAAPVIRDLSPSELEAVFQESLAITDPSYDLPSSDDLDRQEAIGVVDGLFGPLLDGPSGIFDELTVERYLSDYVAVLPAGEEPTAPGSKEGVWTGEVGGGGRVLLDSTIPLRIENADGDVEALDLALEGRAGALRPANPIADVALPTSLGEGITLPSSGIGIHLLGAPERTPSVIEGNVAFYPNVGEDSDFLAAPTPTGVETFTTIRSSEAADTQVYELDLPDEAELRATKEGGAEVLKGEAVLLSVRPPLAFDAAGSRVPVTLAVDGSKLRTEAQLTPEVELPVVVDPTFEETYNFVDGTSGWTSYKDPAGSPINSYVAPGRVCTFGACALTLGANAGPYGQNAMTSWNYAVPRFSQDMTAGKVPSSFIKSAILNFSFGQEGSDWASSPGALLALSNELGAWQVANLYPPNQSGSWGYDMGTSKSAKQLGFALIAHEPRLTSKYRYLWVSGAQLVLGDGDTPTGSASGPGWVGQTAKPIGLELTDSGLGMKSVQVTANSLMPGGVPASWKASLSCTGGVKNPCPREWKSGTAGVPDLPYEPSAMPEGTNQLTVRGTDPLGNSATTTVNVKVDRTPPVVTVGGTITEQATLGVSRPQYAVAVTAKDGSAALPQAGVAKVDVKVDGVLVESVPTTNCPVDNCQATVTVSVPTANLAFGQHSVEVSATDRAGTSSPAVVKTFEYQPDTTKPAISVGQALNLYANGWMTHGTSYVAKATATDQGSGLADLRIGFDGDVIAAKSQACTAGGCGLLVQTTFAAASLKLGPHVAEVQAIDHAGNKATKAVLFSITAEGTIAAEGAEEIADVLSKEEATEGGESAISHLPYEPTLGEANPEFEGLEGSPALEIEGAGVAGRIPEDEPAAGIIIEPAVALPFALIPLGETAGAMSAAGSKSGDAVVYANVRANTDLVTRPIRNGVANFLTMRSSAAASSFAWEVNGVHEPVTLEAREDGGVNLLLASEVEVPTVELEDEQELTTAPQVIASMPAPVVVDGTGNAVAASWSTADNVLTLQIQEAIPTGALPVQAAVLTHVQGGLQGWVPDESDPSKPSSEELSASGATVEEEVSSTVSEVESINEGMELSMFLPEIEPSAVATQMNPVPGTQEGPYMIAAPVGEYAPEPGPFGVERLGLLPGFHAGHVGCGLSGPKKPIKAAALAVQTYGSMACALSGERPPNYGGAVMNVCMMILVDSAGFPGWAFTYSKCKDGKWGGYPRATLTVTAKCADGEYYRGKTDGGPIFRGLAVMNTEWTPGGTEC